MTNVNVKSGLPFYLQIKNDLLDKIKRGVYKKGQLIPSEKELMKIYDVSRVTIRSAIKELVKENHLIRRPGFGTLVTDEEEESMKNFTMVRSFTNEMKEMGLLSKTIEGELETIKADERLAAIFDIEEGSKLYNLRRVRGGAVPIVYSDTYLLPVVEITDEVCKHSLYKFLSEKGVLFDHFDEAISAVNAPKKILKKLHINYDAPELKRVRRSYDEDGRLIEYTENHYNAELYEYRTSISYDHS